MPQQHGYRRVRVRQGGGRQLRRHYRSKRKPEPYKGKGVRYADEVVLIKEGKRK